MDDAAKVSLSYPLPKNDSEVAILTRDNQLIIPESVVAHFPGVDGFEVILEEGRIVLTPIQPTPIEKVWEHTVAQGITTEDIADAVKWARRQSN